MGFIFEGDQGSNLKHDGEAFELLDKWNHVFMQFSKLILQGWIEMYFEILEHKYMDLRICCFLLALSIIPSMFYFRRTWYDQLPFGNEMSIDQRAD